MKTDLLGGQCRLGSVPLVYVGRQVEDKLN